MLCNLLSYSEQRRTHEYGWSQFTNQSRFSIRQWDDSCKLLPQRDYYYDDHIDCRRHIYADRDSGVYMATTNLRRSGSNWRYNYRDGFGHNCDPQH